jgi:hypothetical protein
MCEKKRIRVRDSLWKLLGGLDGVFAESHKQNIGDFQPFLPEDHRSDRDDDVRDGVRQLVGRAVGGAGVDGVGNSEFCKSSIGVGHEVLS